MKVGDLVVQGTRVMKIHKGGKPCTLGTMMGTVVAIREMPPACENEKERLRDFMDLLGRQVDVLWQSGKLSKNFAENSLEVVSEV